MEGYQINISQQRAQVFKLGLYEFRLHTKLLKKFLKKTPPTHIFNKSLLIYGLFFFFLSQQEIIKICRVEFIQEWLFQDTWRSSMGSRWRLWINSRMAWCLNHRLQGERRQITWSLVSNESWRLRWNITNNLALALYKTPMPVTVEKKSLANTEVSGLNTDRGRNRHVCQNP